MLFAAASVCMCWKLVRELRTIVDELRRMQRSAVGQRCTGPSARYSRATTLPDDEDEFTGVQLDCQLGEGPFVAVNWAMVAAVPDEIPAAPCVTAGESTLVPQTEDRLCQVRTSGALASIKNDVALVLSELSPPPLEASGSLPDPQGVPLLPLHEASLHVHAPNLPELPLSEVAVPPDLSLPVLSEAPLLPMSEPAPQFLQLRSLPPLPRIPLPQLPAGGGAFSTSDTVGVGCFNSGAIKHSIWAVALGKNADAGCTAAPLDQEDRDDEVHSL